MKNKNDDRYLVRICKDENGFYFIKRCFNNGTPEMDVKDNKWSRLSVWTKLKDLDFSTEDFYNNYNDCQESCDDFDPDTEEALILYFWHNRGAINNFIDNYDPFNTKDIHYNDKLNIGDNSLDLDTNYECRGIL